MNRKLNALVLAFGIALSACASAGQTADFEDIYLMGWGGWRNSGSLQFGAGAGYVFTEGFGIGALYEQAGTLPYGALEVRWFLEPFESAVAFGMERRLESGRADFLPTFTLSGDYLFSITPSLALRASVKWLIPLESSLGVFTGLGFRVLF